MQQTHDPARHLTSRPGRRRGWIATAFGAVLAGIMLLALWAPNAGTSAVTILGSSSPVRLVDHSERHGVEIGTRFRVVETGMATGIRFWKMPDAVGPHMGTLWTSGGKRFATVTFENETASGWQVARFTEPVTLKERQSYVVSYYAPEGRYAATYDYAGKADTSSLSIEVGSGVYRYGSTSRFPTDTWRNSQYWVDVLFVPQKEAQTPNPMSSPTPTPTPAPAPTPTPTPTPTSTAPAGGFPSANTTGVPAGTVLTDYTGPCRITAPGTVIDAKSVNCRPLWIEAQGVVITHSFIDGIVYTDEHGIGSFTISDSEVNGGPWEGTGIGDARFTATRVHVTGGNRSVNCFLDCTIEYSYLHGQFRDDTGKAHESGIRMGSNAVIRGNTIACDAPDVPPDAGCSAALTGYGDFAAVQNNTIDGNLLIAGSGGYCAYGGSTPGKQFSSGTKNIRFTNNVWQRGERDLCGWWGPITSFDSEAPGNVWSNNRWDDGALVRPAN